MDLSLSLGTPPELYHDELGFYVPHLGTAMRSAFQPIFSVSHRRVVGYEALLRATRSDGQQIIPSAILPPSDDSFEVRQLDRITRELHVRQFMKYRLERSWLFVNIHPSVFLSAWREADVPRALCVPAGIPRDQIVLEVSEELAGHENLLSEAAQAYSAMGYLVAIDDFGAGRANFDRIWQLQPDIIKLDRSLTIRSAEDRTSRLFAKNIISLVHQVGAMVVAEGVETIEQLVALMEADVDFIQGMWFAPPGERPHTPADLVAERTQAMWAPYAARREEAARVAQERGALYEAAMKRVAQSYTLKGDLAAASAEFLSIDGTLRVFMLDADGNQNSIGILCSTHTPHAKLAPLSPDVGANWSRRAYFQNALARPGVVNTVGPHYSLTDGRDCYTSAISVEFNGKTFILCGDFFPHHTHYE